MIGDLLRKLARPGKETPSPEVQLMSDKVLIVGLEAAADELARRGWTVSLQRGGIFGNDSRARVTRVEKLSE